MLRIFLLVVMVALPSLAHAAEHLHDFPDRRLGHKGLFVDRLDGEISSGIESPRLVPFGHVIVHNRQRVYIPTYGRFSQRDPNQTAMQLVAGSHSGRGTGAIALAFSFEGWYGDGHNLYQYLGSNPAGGTDRHR